MISNCFCLLVVTRKRKTLVSFAIIVYSRLLTYRWSKRPHLNVIYLKKFSYVTGGNGLPEIHNEIVN